VRDLLNRLIIIAIRHRHESSRDQRMKRTPPGFGNRFVGGLSDERVTKRIMKPVFFEQSRSQDLLEGFE